MHVHMEHQAARCGLAARHMTRRMRSETTRSEELGGDLDPLLDHDPALLLAALEVIDSRRLALEWLLEADLLRYLVV
jgi:hypothetical protein